MKTNNIQLLMLVSVALLALMAFIFGDPAAWLTLSSVLIISIVFLGYSWFADLNSNFESAEIVRIVDGNSTREDHAVFSQKAIQN